MGCGRLVPFFLVQAAVASDQQRIYVRRTGGLDLGEKVRPGRNDKRSKKLRNTNLIDCHRMAHLLANSPYPFHPKLVRRTALNLTIDMKDVIFYPSQKLWINTACLFEILVGINLETARAAIRQSRS
ncbi:hypothetical protein N7528_007333 [Penicillium herquei]|nr:hypothetical protein N7528_007333 [Penicillium herquei]